MTKAFFRRNNTLQLREDFFSGLLGYSQQGGEPISSGSN